MPRYSEVLRFQEGGRSQHPAPEAAITGPPASAPADAGEMLVVLVDLTPKLPHRSREIRATAVNAYWQATGSVVGRLRRALAEANRHLVHVNANAAPGTKCSGSISCLVFMEDELFLGQIGAAYTYLWNLDNSLELFPKRNRLLIPLGGSLPPVIHISYTQLIPGNTLLLATTWAAEAQARERWQEILAHDTPEAVTQRIAEVMATSQTSGSFVLIQEGIAGPAIPTTRRRRLLPQRVPAPHVAIPAAPAEPADAPPIPPPQDLPPITEPAPSRELPAFFARRDRQRAEEESSQDAASPDLDAAHPRWRIPHIPIKRWTRHMASAWRAARSEGQPPRTQQDEKSRVRQALHTLLPGQLPGMAGPQLKEPPHERASIMSGLTLGLGVLIFFITLSMALQYGGAQRAGMILAQTEEALTLAYSSQKVEDWQRVLALSKRVLSLDGHNEAAQALHEEAQQAIDALENAAVLKAHLLLELGVAPTPRRLVAANNWLYILNTATDEVIELTLNPDGISMLSETPTPILRRGQSFNNVVVERLTDLAWVKPGGTYPDGALFVYEEGGVIYIYEPALGPGNIMPQRLRGNLQGGVSLIETFGQRLYLIQRQDDQILTYDPVNGVYDTGRNYFADQTAPQLSRVLDFGIDGRVYLLMGSGDIVAYFLGTVDPSFEVHDLPDPNFNPIVMAMDPDPERGMIYLGDTDRERILVLNKHGRFRHQFRLPTKDLQQLEALAVGDSPHILYLIAANRLYAAEIPDFVTVP